MNSRLPGFGDVTENKAPTVKLRRLADWSHQTIWAASLTLLLIFGQALPAEKFFDAPANYLSHENLSRLVGQRHLGGNSPSSQNRWGRQPKSNRQVLALKRIGDVQREADIGVRTAEAHCDSRFQVESAREHPCHAKL